jgi:hypothetical protein
MADFEIFDNFLEETFFSNLKASISEENFPWYKSDAISTLEDYGVYFTHTLYEDFEVRSGFFQNFDEIIKFLAPKALIRARLNLYLGTENVEKHGMHTDFEYPHKGALFYINTNNGVTTLDDGAEVNSAANRLLLFDPSKPHCSSSCSDEQYRITLSINYF